MGQLLDQEATQPGVALRTAFHVIGCQILTLLPQHASGGFDKVFNRYRLGIVMAADEIVGREPTPGRRPLWRALRKQAGIIEVCRGHFVFSPCAP